MLRFAIIENDDVINVIVADAEFIKENKIDGVECGDEIYAGWKYKDKKFIAPQPNISQRVDPIDEPIP